MKNSIFCNRVLSLISETDVDRLVLSFNELIVEQYAATKKPFLLMRSIRQARIRLSIAIETYEVSGRCARTVLKLLEAEEELLHDQSQARNYVISSSTIPKCDGPQRLATIRKWCTVCMPSVVFPEAPARWTIFIGRSEVYSMCDCPCRRCIKSLRPSEAERKSSWFFLNECTRLWNRESKIWTDNEARIRLTKTKR